MALIQENCGMRVSTERDSGNYKQQRRCTFPFTGIGKIGYPPRQTLELVKIGYPEPFLQKNGMGFFKRGI